jgi:hypothetical protein
MLCFKNMELHSYKLNLYFYMDVKHGLLQVKSDVKYKVLLIDVLGTS